MDFEEYTYEACRRKILRELCRIAKANPKKYIVIDQYSPIYIRIRDYDAPNKADRIVDKIGGVISNGNVEAWGAVKTWGRRTPLEWTARNMKVTERY